MVVLDRVARYADGPDHLAGRVDNRYPAGEGDQPAVGMLDGIQRPAGLRKLPDLAGGHVEEAGGAGLANGNVRRTEPAPSMRAKPFKWVPVSTTAMFIFTPNCWALAKAASIAVWAWAKVMSGIMVSLS